MANRKLKKADNNGKQNERIAQPQSGIAPLYVEDTRSLPVALKEKLTSALTNITTERVMGLISKLANGNEIWDEAVKFINKQTTYIARIPKELQADKKLGLLDFMIDKKTGDNLGMLVDQKHKTKGYMRIDEVCKVNIASNLASIAIQQQLACMTEIINDVRSRVISLQEGHDNDLFGSIKGMHQQLLQMRDARNPETRKQLATHAITILNDVRGRIEQTILSTLREIESVPSTDLAILLKIAKNKNFLADTVEKYNRIEELLGYYITATQLLGYAYAFLGEPAAYEDIFVPSSELIESKNLRKLLAAEKLFEESIGETWYKNPEKYLLRIASASHNVFMESSDKVEIEVSGKQLLEAIERGKKSSKENGKAEIPNS